MTIHDLKCHPQHFQCVFNGSKQFELRLNDRNYQIGDDLLLREWDPNTSEYTGKVTVKTVTCIVSECPALKKSYVALGIK